jgi:hypothetical protein
MTETNGKMTPTKMVFVSRYGTLRYCKRQDETSGARNFETVEIVEERCRCGVEVVELNTTIMLQQM